MADHPHVCEATCMTIDTCRLQGQTCLLSHAAVNLLCYTYDPSVNAQLQRQNVIA